MPHHTNPPPVYPPLPPDPPDPDPVSTGNDQINDAIMAVVGPAINDGLLAYYKTNGAVSDTLQDAEFEFFEALTVPITVGSLQDRWFTFLTDQGFSVGSLDDRRLAFWLGGGIIV